MDYEYYEQSRDDEAREALAYDPVIDDDEFYGGGQPIAFAEDDFADFLYELHADK